MKRLLIYTMLSMLLAGCASDVDMPEENLSDAYGVKVKFVQHPVTRADAGGVYTGMLPIDQFSLWGVHTDALGDKQIYFSSLTGLSDDGNGVWTADGWYWPIQGKMRMFTAWTDDQDLTKTFSIKTTSEGEEVPVLTIQARTLDGYHDLVYGTTADFNCPTDTAVYLPVYHALSWINMRLYTHVCEDDGETFDRDRLQELADALTVHKIYIESCSRGGDALITGDSEVKWSIPDKSYVSDQVYRYTKSGFTWVPATNGAKAEDSERPLHVNVGSDLAPYLGLYDRLDANHTAYGLLIVPQQKTSIVMEYSLTIGEETIRRTQRFDLSDNGDWKANGVYYYDIVFRNYSELGATIELIPTWVEVLYDPTNRNYENGAFGTFVVNNNGTIEQWGTNIVIDHMHDGGSLLGDDMDYHNGGTVF